MNYRRLAPPLFFASGVLGLIYELYWMRELTLLFGATAHAAAVTLAAFFAGQALGGGYWGARAPKLQRPLRTWGSMELGIALSAGGCLALLPVFGWVYPGLHELFGSSPGLMLSAKFFLSFLLLLPAAFLMGGTLPVMNHFYANAREGRGSAILLYALNTLGGVGGVLLAGIYLPAAWGYDMAYGATLAASAAMGLIGYLAGGRVRTVMEGAQAPCWALPLPSGTFSLAFLSGAVVVALEVLWTRMFAQVLQNSVQTFALILAVCVLGLALGALLAKCLVALGWLLDACLYGVLTSAAVLVAATPREFVLATEGLRYSGQGLGWGAYLVHVAGLIGAVTGPALMVLGTVFPLLLARIAQAGIRQGPMLGQLLRVNALGAVCGALAAGFLLLDWFGLWSSIRLLGMLYLLAALASEYFRRHARGWQRALPLACALLSVSALDSSGLPLVRIDPLNEDESLLQAWEDSAATVAVVRHGDQLKIKQDNHYTLGGSGSAAAEALQGSLPVLLHPEAETVFALGLGTGITAGAALHHPIRRLDVAELLPNAIEAARLYFAPYHFGLFEDPRARVLQADGRNWLAVTRQHYDVIVGDLFVPWQAGTGSLYALEHFRAVRERLREGGLFMQWIPAYQVSRAEFGVIARTMLEVFPQVTLWRGDGSPRTPVLGLLGQASPAPLPPGARLFSGAADALDLGGARLLTHYVGRLTPERFAGYEVNSDDRPVIEFNAPITQRQQKLGQAHWLTGLPLLEFLTGIRKASGEARDPYLAALAEGLRRLPEAGLCLQRAAVERQEGYLTAAEGSQACAVAILDELDHLWSR